MIEEEKVFYLTDPLTGILEEGDDLDKGFFSGLKFM